ncbi:MAG: membrane protein [Dehalococcoidia bacterium]|nr:MAG: membrane protein [Dehalococcoidia bacterium]
MIPVLTAVPSQPDLAVYYVAGAALNAGESPYDPTALDRVAAAAGVPFDASGYTFASPFLYPPFFAVLARPLALLPYPIVQIGWLLMNVVLIVTATLGLAWRVGLRSVAVAAGLVALIAPPTLETLLYGQINALLYALLGGALLAPRVGGALIAIASAIKLFPAITLLAFVRARQRGQLAAAALTGFVAGAAGLWLAGVSRTVEYVVVVAPAVSGTALQPENQSIQAVLLRLLTPSQHRYSAYTADDPQLVAFPAFVELPWLAAPLAWLLIVLILTVTAVTLWQRPSNLGFGVALLLSTALLVTPVVWDHYLVLLVVPALVLLGMAHRRCPRWPDLLGSREARSLALAALFLGVHRFWKPLTLLVTPTPLLLVFGLLASATIWLALVQARPGAER